ncbi:unnamed protein product [Symbiodinium sp. KB8]|nr:unnamed protein product [Symbiodinium sp. KB8]
MLQLVKAHSSVADMLYDPYIDASPDFASRHSKGPIFSFGLSSRDGMGKPKIPGPGAYELAKEAGSSTSKWTITPRREKPGASAAGAAVSGAGTGTASAATTGGGAAAAAAPVTGFGDTPGPGDYEIEALLGKRSPKYSAGKKFDSGEAEKCPGPGDYWQAFDLGLRRSWAFGGCRGPILFWGFLIIVKAYWVPKPYSNFYGPYTTG